MNRKKRKLMNRIVSLFAALILVVSVLPLSAQEEALYVQQKGSETITLLYPKESYVDDQNVHYYNADTILTMRFNPAVAVTQGAVKVKRDGSDVPVIGNWDVSRKEVSFTLSGAGSYQFEASGTSITKTDFETVVIDTTAPAVTEVEYSTAPTEDGVIYASDEITAVIKGSDEISGIKEFRWQYVKQAEAGTGIAESYQEATVQAVEGADGYTAEIQLPKTKGEQLRGILKVTATDFVGNVSDSYESSLFIVDSVQPDITVQYDSTYLKNRVSGVSRESVEAGSEDENTEYVYCSGVAVDVTVEEANFDKQNQVDLAIEKDGVPVAEGAVEIEKEWQKNPNTNQYTKKVMLKDNGVYVLKIADYIDKSGNHMKYHQSYQKGKVVSGEGEYISNKIIIDQEKPSCEIDYEGTFVYEKEKKHYCSPDCSAVIKITDKNFRPDEVEVTLSAVDVTGSSISYNIPDLTLWEQWDYKDGCWIARIPFNKEADYKLELNYKDLAGNELPSKISEEFAIDTTAPDEPEVSYESQNPINKVLGAITFGIYKPKVKVTFTTYDYMSGVKEFQWFYKRQQGASEQNKESAEGTVAAIQDPDNKHKYTATVELPEHAAEQLRGNMTVLAVDHVGNATTGKEDKEVVIVDTIHPQASIRYSGKLANKVQKDAENAENPGRETVTDPNEDTRFVYNGEVKATIQLVEANKDLKDMQIAVTCDGVKAAADGSVYVVGDWVSDGNDTYHREITLKTDGDYVIGVTYSDIAENVMDYESDEYAAKKGQGIYTSNIITIDTIRPEYEIIYDNNNSVRRINDCDYFRESRTAQIKIKDRNFRPNEIIWNVKAVNVDGKEISGYTYPKLNQWSDWQRSAEDPDTWLAKVEFTKEAHYIVEFGDYADIAGNDPGEPYYQEFVIDRTGPTDIKISYSEPVRTFVDTLLTKLTFGYYNMNDKPLKVTVEAADVISGVDYFEVNMKTQGSAEATDVQLPTGLRISAADGRIQAGNKGCIKDITAADLGNGKSSITFTVPAQFRGEFTANAANYLYIRSDADPNTAGNQDYNDDWVTIVDDIAPQVTIAYQGPLQDSIEKDTQTSVTRQTVTDHDENTRFIYNGAATAVITVDEANFYEDMEIHIQRDGVDVTESINGDISAWVTGEAMTHKKTVVLREDGDYVITIDYTDRSDNDMEYQSAEYIDAQGTGSYRSNIITIDTVKPVYEVTYDNNNLIQTVNGCEYYDHNRTAAIKITDRNFRPNEVKIEISAKDVTGQDVAAFIAPDLTRWENWTRDALDPNCWTAAIPFKSDANYSFTIQYTDIAKNPMATNYNIRFTVDKVRATAPKITYSQRIVSKFIGALTFGFYQPDMTVTIESDDATSGVDYFEWQLVKQDHTSNINNNMEEAQRLIPSGYSNNRKTATASFTVPASSRGYISATAYDRSANRQNVKDTARINVIDNVSPQVSIDYRAIDAENTKVQLINAYGATTDRYDHATQVFFNGDVGATITINEANFFEGTQAADGVIHNVGILLKKTDDNENVTYTEYLPSDSQPYEFGIPEARGRDYRTFEWQNNGDVHTFQITYDTDSDYVLTLVYKDLSANAANISSNVAESGRVSYTSKDITVDKTNPHVYVEYSNHDVKNTIDGRNYYNSRQSATITVTEHNFRADDIAAMIKATDVEGNRVFVEDYAGYLANRSSWTKKGNVYTARITYSAEANYTFDIDYKDLAQNASADYSEDLFTVDLTAPSNLTVDYSENVLERILEAVTFGFYDRQMTVTISAEDDISGIWYMDYSYMKSEGVSAVNQELLNERLTNAAIEYNGARATTQFTIPKGALAADSQFNGTVEFYAYDRAEWSTEFEDTRRIIVDNIAPTASVTYNSPIQTFNNVNYYDQDINVTIVIEEANFYSEDVNVAVTRDGGNYPVNVQWNDNSVDTHTGTFTISGDGDYHMTVNYTDKSTNKMTEYVSEQMTIDTKMPVITVTNVKNESANKEDTIGFSITVTDKNISEGDFVPELNAVVKKKIGENTFAYENEPISLGNVEASTTQEGESIYQYTVDNLQEDGYYTLSCRATDRANHTVSTIEADNGSGTQGSYEAVNFSVNRDGSVFWIETTHKNKEGKEYKNELDGKYVNGEVSVQLHEINVDEVDTQGAEQTELTLNNGSSAEKITLDENNYEKNVRIGEGGWYENIYSLTNENNFKNDGRYTINIVTHDKAQNINSNINNEEGVIDFTIDRTKPNISANAESGQQINDAAYNVELTLSDANLDADSIEVKMDGKKMDAEDLKKLGDGVYGFEMKNGLNQSFVVDVKDLAGNAADAYSVDNFTVSTNIFVLWYANTKLFWGSIIGFAMAAGALILIIVLKKRSKKAKES
ncbi:MAG: hypothetical protein HFI75_05040 [Lachnospiraceae bacterium]|nr:hypothetical protein [Lachnospiraceae bacterium]